jgi:mitochondrial fission protein ELM1
MWPGSSDGLDLVIVPAHDRAAGRPDVAVVRAIPHRLSGRRLEGAAARLAPELVELPRPRLACLIGGSRAGVRLGGAEASALARTASALADSVGGSLLVATSRRSGEDVERGLRSSLTVPHRLFTAETPFEVYAGILGIADELIVTADSASMLAEACAVGRPVRLFRPPEWRLGKLERLHAALGAWLRPLDAPVRPAQLPRLDSSEEAAALVRGLLEHSAASPYISPRCTMGW